MAVRTDRELELQVGAREAAATVFGPFDQPQVAGTMVVSQSQVFELGRILEPVEVEMNDRHRGQWIRLEQRVARALDRTGDAERAQSAARERRLARAEIAGE